MKSFIILILVSYILLGGTLARASWRIEAKRLLFLHQTKVLVAEGEVIITGEETTIICQRARYEVEPKRVVLWGPLKIISADGDQLEGRFAWIDLKTNQGEIDQGHLFLAKDKVHILATKMERTKQGGYRAREAVITTCDVCINRTCNPDWSFRCKDLQVTPAGRAKAKHVTFNVKPVPVLYSPYVSFSVKKGRESGFLFPRLVHGSREGFGLEIPFFWNINDSLDLTFYPYYTHKRGFMSGIEGRYALAKEQRGVLRTRYIRDKKDDNDYNNDGIVRTNKKRYWVNGKFDHLLAPSWEAHLDLDILSDRDFLYEFAGGPLGFRSSHKTYLKQFGRGLDEINSSHRRSILWLNHPWKGYFFQSDVAYYDSQIKNQDQTLQPLPRLYFSRLTAPLWGPINFSTRIEYVYWWREEGYRGHRLDLYPELNINPVLWQALDLRFAYRLRSTFYRLNWKDNRGKDTKSRKLHEVDLLGAANFSKIWPFHFRSIKWVKHTIRPEVRYFYRSKEGQKDLPNFVLEDRLPPVDRLEYRIIQFVTAREEVNGQVRFFDLLRLWISQSYDFREARRKLESKKEQRRPFSDLLVEGEVKLFHNFYLRANSSYNFYGLGWATANITADLHNDRGEYIGFDYRWDRARDVKQLNFRGRKHIYRGFSFSYEGEYSFTESEFVSSTWGFHYVTNCWEGTFTIYHNPDETRFSLYFNLLGIGGFGR